MGRALGARRVIEAPRRASKARAAKLREHEEAVEGVERVDAQRHAHDDAEQCLPRVEAERETEHEREGRVDALADLVACATRVEATRARIP